MSDNPGIWYAIVSNMIGKSEEFVGGVYLVRIIIPDNYPFEPPSFVFLTPNGFCKVGETPCVDMGAEHPLNYKATLGILGFMNIVIGTIEMDWENISGRHFIHEPLETVRTFAEQSTAYNAKHYSNILTLFTY
jgi:hypothetical protein